jgi:hypothetical protein
MKFSGLIKGWMSTDAIKNALHEHGANTAVFDTLVVTKRPDSHHGIETHFEVESTTGPDALESAMHAWFQVPQVPGDAPFPEGTLLHFAYCTDGGDPPPPMLHPDLLDELDEAQEIEEECDGDSGGCEECRPPSVHDALMDEIEPEIEGDGFYTAYHTGGIS